MFVLRFLVLLFLVVLTFFMGPARPVPLTAFEDVMVVCFFVLALALYLLPTYEAWTRKHLNRGAIAVLNIFLGWSLVFWVAALVWAFTKQHPK